MLQLIVTRAVPERLNKWNHSKIHWHLSLWQTLNKFVLFPLQKLHVCWHENTVSSREIAQSVKCVPHWVRFPEPLWKAKRTSTYNPSSWELTQVNPWAVLTRHPCRIREFLVTVRDQSGEHLRNDLLADI